MTEQFNETETKFQLGEDLYGVSIAQLKGRLHCLQSEIARTEAELLKKEKDISAAHEIFGR